MSERDLEAGARWNERIQRELSETRFGILCVTSQNVAAPWLLFEAGALAKTLQDTYVCPYLIGIEPTALPQGPLAQFQAKRANKAETKALVMTVNQALGESALDPTRVEKSFERWWPDLERVLSSLPQQSSLEESVPKRTPEDMLEEILLLVREIGRQTSDQLSRGTSLASPSRAGWAAQLAKTAADTTLWSSPGMLAYWLTLSHPDRDHVKALYNVLRDKLAERPVEEDDEVGGGPE